MRNVFFLLMLVSSNAFADMVSGASQSMERAAFAPPPPMNDIAFADVKAHYQKVQNLITVADALKITTITTYALEASNVQLPNIIESITKKISENPMWKTSLDPSQIELITPHLELIKTSFGEKSYAWAWFLKQTGKTSEVKKILQDLFAEKAAAVMSMGGTYNQQSPMGPVTQIQEALMPLSNQAEKALIQKKMNELKVHVSNLKDYSIMT